METEYRKIAEQAGIYKTVRNLMHCVNAETLKAAHVRQQKRKAAGVDGVTKAEYELNLDENLDRLISSMRTFSYKPQPVRRTYIPKPGSDKKRPLGIPAYEDKLVQGVMANILTMVYEQKFKDFSFGFRPNRDCHQAITALASVIMTKKTGFVVDADIKGFFDNVDHSWLIRFLEHDIEDRNFIRYIKRFLKSGIMEQGKRLESDKGTPQGGLISPILANVYLHYVLDLWFEKMVSQKFSGEAHMVRYADDFVCCFQYESEARKFFEMLKERFARFGLELAEDKSKIIRFGRYAKEYGSRDTFDFLGFTHINGLSPKNKYIIIHQTSKKKLVAKRQATKQWLRENMHMDKGELVRRLNVKLMGHYRYYGITGNGQKITSFAYYVTRELFKTLNRRSDSWMSWKEFYVFLQHNPIAKPKIYHSLLPDAR